MYILNVEDDVLKHHDICKILERCGAEQIDRAVNLEEGLAMIRQSVRDEHPYDLIVTDMYYPPAPGESETQAGMQLIEEVAKMDCDIPIVVCSSVRFRIPEILGTVHYSQRSDWENELGKLVNEVRTTR